MQQEEVSTNIFKIEIPLPGNPLRATNSYLIKGYERNLIIDTGFNLKECFDAMSKTLQYMKINMDFTDFFITHLHNDHLDLVRKVASSNSKVYLGQKDAKVLDDTNLFKNTILRTIKHGFPYKEFKNNIEMYLTNERRKENLPYITEIYNGDKIIIGDYEFNCLETPGHTWGHMCLYDKDNKILFSGDHILLNTTPVVLCWGFIDNPLEKFLLSLDRIYNLDDVEIVFPGHGESFSYFQKRIEEIKKHHNKRLNEVLTIIENNPGVEAYKIASLMDWDITYKSFEEINIFHRWFATGEALAHIKYLEETGKVKNREEEGKVVHY